MSTAPSRVPRWSTTAVASSGWPRPENTCMRFLVTTSMAGVPFSGCVVANVSASGVTLDDLLLATLDGERTGRDILGDDGPRARVRVVPDLHGSDQHRVAANPHAVADRRLVLATPVVIDRDRRRTDVRILPNGGVADVGQMRNLAARTDHRLLDLDERSGLGALLQPRLGPQVAERPDLRAGPDPRGYSDAEGHVRLGADRRVDKAGVGTDDRAARDGGRALQVGARQQHRVRLDHAVGLDVRGI